MPLPVSPLRELMQVMGTLLIAAVGGIGFQLIGFPGGLVSGSMLTVAVAALAGQAVKVPPPLARLCFVLVGILLGAVVTPDTLKGVATWPLSVALLVVAAVVSTRGATEPSLVELAILLTASGLSALAMLRIRFPGGLLFGAMAGSAFLHGTGLIHVSLPWWAGSAAVLTLGAVAGARFANTSPKILLSYLAAAFGSFAVAVAVAASFALVVVALLPFRIADVIVAFAPGAQDTMMVLALAMHLDPVYVGAHHLARFLAVSFSVAVVARRLISREPTRPRKQWRRPGQGTFDD